MHIKNPSRCAVLVPVQDKIQPDCEKGLRDLEKRGYTVRRVRGFAAIDEGRNHMASQALREGFTETMWIDSDIGFEADDVEKLRSHNLPIIAGIYAKKGPRALAIHVLPGTKQIVLGEGGGLVELRYAATGFLHVRSEVYTRMQKKLKLPTCNVRFGNPLVPFFQPMVIPDGNGHWYLPEDYAFFERSRQCDFKIMADTTIRLKHFGDYGYSWEDAGGKTKRFKSYNFNIGE